MKKRIIIAEDDQDLLLMLVTLLNTKGYEVLGLPNGLSIIEEHCEWPDLFILDKEMDFIDGVAITKFLRMHKKTKEIPIVMLSGSMSRTSATAAGVDFYMEKPINVTEFVSTVDKYLNSPSPVTSLQ
ncbi:MAG TPA: response regulator [Cyclobacteriaceae bacterium]